MVCSYGAMAIIVYNSYSGIFYWKKYCYSILFKIIFYKTLSGWKLSIIVNLMIKGYEKLWYIEKSKCFKYWKQK